MVVLPLPIVTTFHRHKTSYMMYPFLYKAIGAIDPYPNKILCCPLNGSYGSLHVGLGHALFGWTIPPGGGWREPHGEQTNTHHVAIYAKFGTMR